MKPVSEYRREELHEAAELLQCDFVGTIKSSKGMKPAEVKNNSNAQYNRALIKFLLRTSSTVSLPTLSSAPPGLEPFAVRLATAEPSMDISTRVACDSHEPREG